MSAIDQESTQRFIFKDSKSRELQELLDESRIVTHVTELLRVTKEVPQDDEETIEIFKISHAKREEIIFSANPGFDNISEHLFSYQAKELICYKNAKIRIEQLGFIVKETDHNGRLCWIVTDKKARL